MSLNSKVQWCTATWPITAGCKKNGAECTNCYAIRDIWRLSNNPNPKVSGNYAGIVSKDPVSGKLDWTGLVRELPDRLDWPTKWKNEIVFVHSQADLFHPNVSTGFLLKVWEVMLFNSQNEYIVLTKFPKRMKDFLDSGEFRDKFGPWTPPDHITLATTAGLQTSLWRLFYLITIPAKKRMLSAEPLLGPMLIPPEWMPFISQIIAGGESAAYENCQPMDPADAWALQRQCAAHGVPFFFKQNGSFTTKSFLGRRTRQLNGKTFYHVGKKLAGELLDGIEFKESPRLLDGSTFKGDYSHEHTTTMVAGCDRKANAVPEAVLR